MWSRRRFFTRAGLISASAVAFPNIGRPAGMFSFGRGQRPKHIIHLVADGMSMGTLTCADYFSQIVRNRGLTFMRLFNDPQVRSGLMNMRSLNSMVTDSSAASSSWGSGSRIVNGYVNVLPDKTKLTTLYQLFGEQGWKRGLVTTTEITHATPAGFAATVDNRDTGSAIAVQYLERNVEVLLGGGQKFFDAKTRKDKRDLARDYKAAGYQVMTTADELDAADTTRPWLGTFANSHLPFTIDHIADEKLVAKVPTLAEMTARALKWLGRHNHFILQVEGGRVDQACHNCDAPSALRDMIAFDEAIDEVLEFRRRNPDTLVVITTDHGNGNMASNGAGKAYGQSSPMFAHTATVKASFSEIMRRLRKKAVVEDTEEKKDSDADGFNAKQTDTKTDDADSKTDTKTETRTDTGRRSSKPKDYVPTPQEVIDIVYECTGYKASERRAKLLIPFLEKKGTPLYDLMNNEMVQLGQLVGNRIGIGWTGNAHTSDYVPILASGPGAERFAGFIQNVDVFRHYTQLAKIDFRNPARDLLAGITPENAGVEHIEEYMLG
jgi:alkaline phosphatase